MIVRRHVLADGRPGWLLISQVDHAEVSWQLAQAWEPQKSFADVPPLAAAILHHDDGWQAWDLQPGVDPATGVPRDFLHMEVADAIAIWTRSIDQAAAYGILCQWLVSSHFAALLEHSQTLSECDSRSPARQFLSEEKTRCHALLERWLQQGPARSVEQAAWGLKCLQFFDRFSLWFCCGECSGLDNQAARLTLPDDSTLTLRPQGEQTWSASPWLWPLSELKIEVAARWLPDGRYTGGKEVAAACQSGQRLKWRLVA